MKNLIKSILLACVVVLTASVLTGCDDPAPAPAPMPAPMKPNS